MSEELPDDFFGDVARPNAPEYTALERYRDFRALFLGSDQGRKVLVQIMKLGNCHRTSAAAGSFDTNKTFFHDGMRNLAHTIFVTASVEPKPLPTQANSKRPKE